MPHPVNDAVLAGKWTTNKEQIHVHIHKLIPYIFFEKVDKPHCIRKKTRHRQIQPPGVGEQNKGQKNRRRALKEKEILWGPQSPQKHDYSPRGAGALTG